MNVNLLHKSRAIWLLSMLSLLCTAPGCGDDASDETPSGDDDTAQGDDDSEAEAQLLVITEKWDYSSGHLTTVQLDDDSVQPDLLEVGADTTVRAHGGLVYLLVRDWEGTHSVSVRDPNQAFAEVQNIPTGIGSNPQDVAFASGKGYVSLNNGIGVLVFEELTGAPIKTLDLTAYADEDGLPDANALAVDGTTLYVALQRAVYGTSVSYASPGMVVAIDTRTDLVLKNIPTLGTNLWELYVEPSGDVLASSRGDYGVQDGGLERIIKTTLTTTGFLITEATLESTDFGPFVVWNGIGYCAPNNRLEAFSTADGMFLGDVEGAESISIQRDQLLSSSDGRLWFADDSGRMRNMSLDDGELDASSGIDLGEYDYIYSMDLFLP